MIQISQSPVVHLELEVRGSRAKMRGSIEDNASRAANPPNTRGCIRRQPNLLLR